MFAMSYLIKISENYENNETKTFRYEIKIIENIA